MKILIVDDDQAVHEALQRLLTFNDYTVEPAEDGAETLGKIAKNRPGLIILDIMTPKFDGLGIHRRLCSEGDDLSVMMLTARNSVSECIAGLDAGADDYLFRPFALEELLARVHSLLRRSVLGVPVMEDAATPQFESLSLGPETREVFHGEHRINLIHTELALLELLMSNPWCVFSRTVILEDVWGYDLPASGSALEVYTGYLRRKTEVEGEPRLIYTVRGVGYVMRGIVP